MFQEEFFIFTNIWISSVYMTKIQTIIEIYRKIELLKDIIEGKLSIITKNP